MTVEEKMTQTQIKTWEKFNSFVLSELSENNQKSYRESVKKLLPILKEKDFSEATQEDFEELFQKLRKPIEKAKGKNAKNQKERSPSYRSINTYLIRIKRFYKWIYKEIKQDLPDFFTSELFKLRKTESAVKKEDILTEEEIFRMMDVCESLRDKALIILVYEAFGRISEVLNLKIGDIQQDKKKGYWYVKKTIPKIGIKGKQGEFETRNIPINLSVGYIENWLNAHPLGRDNLEAPLFIAFKRNQNSIEKPDYQRLGPNRAIAIIERAGKNAGIKKYIHPHLLRHSAIVNKRNKGFSDKNTRAVAGWTVNSNMLRIYDKFTDAMTDNIASELGIQVEEKEAEPEFLVCPRCHTKNFPTEDLCVKCFLPLKESLEYPLSDVEEEVSVLKQENTDLKQKLESFDRKFNRLEQLILQQNRTLETVEGDPSSEIAFEEPETTDQIEQYEAAITDEEIEDQKWLRSKVASNQPEEQIEDWNSEDEELKGEMN
jgi:integrase